jgi:hypothetical protein
MTPEPGALFGGLLRACISDRYLPRGKGAAVEGFAFVILGLCSSFLTTYFLSAVGYLV